MAQRAPAMTRARDTHEMHDASAAHDEPCARCGKPRALCVCDRIEPIDPAPRIEVLILQHPREPDKRLGTARLTELLVPTAQVRVGLSWASLSHALGREVSPVDWAVMYLGSLRKPLTPAQQAQPVVVVDRHGDPRDVRVHPLAGIVVLDGTWSQARSMWWRNAWMLKLGRVILHPTEPSAYGRLRKEPRRECLSTIEAVGEALAGLGEGDEVCRRLRSVFRTLVQRARDAPGNVGAAPRPTRSRHARGHVRRSRGGGPMD
jgi:DTW domain-containing protein YfiP